MAFRRGEIHLANFNPSKETGAGKIRPCLIIQSDLLNVAEHPSTSDALLALDPAEMGAVEEYLSIVLALGD